MNMCINVPWQFEIILPDGSPGQIIYLNGYVYKIDVKIRGNKNNA